MVITVRMKSRKTYTFILLLGDFLALYLALGITLIIKYNPSDIPWAWSLHQFPFTVVFAIWLLLFFIAGLYDQIAWNANRAVKERLIRAMVAASLLAAVLFYLVPAFGITPKTNLVIQVFISAGLILAWRVLFSAIIQDVSKTNILFFGLSDEVLAYARFLVAHPHLGYRVAALVPTADEHPTASDLPLVPFDQNLPVLIGERKITLVVASRNLESHKEFTRMLFEILPTGVTFADFARFYETLSGKIPVSLISEVWFLENITESGKRFFEGAKRFIDIVGAVVIGVPSLILYPVVALSIKLDTTGPLIIKQKRVGRNDTTFTLYKFRSMRALGSDGSAELHGAAWAQDHDERITRVGKILRKTRIDELPQLWNVLRGELSFIGPRPERPEFVEKLKKEIPFYEIRHLIRPGLSGWAQINFPYGASVEDATEKLQYDLYYIKNRSLTLDLGVALKTLLVMASGTGK